MSDGTLRHGRYRRDQRKTLFAGQQRSDSMAMKTAVHLAAEAQAGNKNLSWEEVTATLHRSEGHRRRSEDARLD
jgi:Tfp pilus assembly major pilin PilA